MAGVPVGDRLEVYRETVELLWPDVRHTGAAADEMLVPVPSARAPRLLVPASSARAASRAMLRFSSALSPLDVASRLAVACALRTGAGRLSPDALTVVDGPDSIQSYLGTVLGQPVVVSLGLGTARANRKPVLEVFDRSGRPLAFVKVGATQVAAGHVTSEAAALRRLSEVALPRTISVPHLIDMGDWRDLPVLVMTHLPTAAVEPTRRTSPPVAEMNAFSRAFDGGRQALVETSWWTSVWSTIGSVTAPETAVRLSRALTALADLAGDQRLEIGAWHGDWTSWNQSRGRSALRLWDWERFEEGVPASLDPWHFAVNTQLRRHGVSTDAVLSGLSNAGLDRTRRGDPAYLSAACYLAAITCRYLRGAEGDGGELIRASALVMLTCLEDHVDCVPTTDPVVRRG